MGVIFWKKNQNLLDQKIYVLAHTATPEQDWSNSKKCDFEFLHKFLQIVSTISVQDRFLNNLADHP